MLRTVNVIRYVTPLREGGSLPALAEADDEYLYVLKFRGAGQGAKALVAELLGCEIARALGLKVPEVVFANLAEGFGRLERDEEIQDLLKFSKGLNLGIHYLSGAISFDPAAHTVDPAMASMIVWLDGLLMNVDRTVKNTNLLMWHKTMWVIDHGASLYFHHGPTDWEAQALRPFERIKDHVLLKHASDLDAADARAHELLTPSVIAEICAWLPDEFLSDDMPKDEQRTRYANFLKTRLRHSKVFVNEAKHARAGAV
jgi:hypothetical protein